MSAIQLLQKFIANDTPEFRHCVAGTAEFNAALRKVVAAEGPAATTILKWDANLRGNYKAIVYCPALNIVLASREVDRISLPGFYNGGDIAGFSERSDGKWVSHIVPDEWEITKMQDSNLLEASFSDGTRRFIFTFECDRNRVFELRRMVARTPFICYVYHYVDGHAVKRVDTLNDFSVTEIYSEQYTIQTRIADGIIVAARLGGIWYAFSSLPADVNIRAKSLTTIVMKTPDSKTEYNWNESTRCWVRIE